MKVTAFLAAEYGAITNKGLVDLCGIGVTKMTISKIPGAARLVFFIRCESELLEKNGKHEVAVMLVEGDKKIQSFDFEFETSDAHRTVQDMSHYTFPIEREGIHTINVVLDGNIAGEWPIDIRLGSS